MKLSLITRNNTRLYFGKRWFHLLPYLGIGWGRRTALLEFNWLAWTLALQFKATGAGPGAGGKSAPPLPLRLPLPLEPLTTASLLIALITFLITTILA